MCLLQLLSDRVKEQLRSDSKNNSEVQSSLQSFTGLGKQALTPQGFGVPQDPVQGLSWDLLKGFVGWSQERVLPFAFQQAVEVRSSHSSLQRNEGKTRPARMQRSAALSRQSLRDGFITAFRISEHLQKS